MIKTIFLDLDDTLFDFKRAEASAIGETLSALSVRPTEQIISRYSEINKLQWERLERGEATRDEILTERFNILFSELCVPVTGIEARGIYEKKLSEKHFYIDGAEELLDELFGKYDLYLASNGTAKVQDKRIGDSGISKYFKNVFISERIGYNKPSREFFEACAREISGYKKEEAIIVGDSLSSDILGGINAGILTCHYNPKGTKYGETVPDYEIRELSELPLPEGLGQADEGILL